jgi:putative cell wall-binding protein
VPRRLLGSGALVGVVVVALAVLTGGPAHADPRNREPARLAAAASDGGIIAAATQTPITTTVLGGSAVVPDTVATRAGLVAGRVRRDAGSDRYATAVLVSRRLAPAGAGEVVLASGEDFPDALAAAPLAARIGAPLLLTASGRLPTSVATELARLGPSRLTVVGGTGAVTDATAAAARRAAGGSTVALRRLAGSDRYATSAQVASLFPAGRPGTVLASGATFPDAVSAGPLAARLDGPLLLTPTARLATPARDQLRRLRPARLVVAGGTGVVAGATASAASSAAGVDAERAAGADRYETSSLLARLVSALGRSTGAVVATGADFPDALVGGVAAAASDGPVLLTGQRYGALGGVAADLGRARGVGEWTQLALDALARQQRLAGTKYVAYDAAYQATTLATLYGWSEPEVAAQLQRLRSVRKPDGGYGMERSWDAFGDGSVNPASTSYLISMTDHAGVALLAGFRAGAVSADEVGALVDLVLAFPTVEGDPDCLAYSTAPTDRSICVYNVNSAAAWFLQSAWDAGVRRSPTQSEMAQRLYRHDVALAVDGWWPYSSTRLTQKQDWNHNAAMIDFQFQLDVTAGQQSLDVVMPGGWLHPDPALRSPRDVIGYARLLPYACGDRGGVVDAAAPLVPTMGEASDLGQLALWSVRTAASCGG